MKMVNVAVIVVAGFVVAGADRPIRAAQDVELDRVVSRVGGRIITQSDIRQARDLRLVEDTSSDEAVRVALENRLLLLGEVARGQALPPITADEITQYRAGWVRSLGGADVADLMRRTGATESMIDTWHRDDLRIRAVLDRQFAHLPRQDRARATSEWLSRLRQRAGL
jgi:hypothetical protein